VVDTDKIDRTRDAFIKVFQVVVVVGSRLRPTLMMLTCGLVYLIQVVVDMADTVVATVVLV
jgi:hypothetical protein